MQTRQQSSWGRIFPASNAGRLAVGAFCAHVAFFAMLAIAAASGQEGGESFLDNLWLTVPAMLAGVAVITAALAGLYALVRRRDWTIVTVLVALYGLFGVLFIAGELLMPH